MGFGNKKTNFFLKVGLAGISGIIALFGLFIIVALMILNFFTPSITVSSTTINENADYANAYKKVLNKYLASGYVPLSRLLYFYSENNLFTFDEIYQLNQDYELKTMKSLNEVCSEEKFKNMVVCDASNVSENENKLALPLQYFNFPLKDGYTVTSFFNEERVVFGNKDNHNGWDLATPARTPVYSVCSGIVKDVSFKYHSNITNSNGGLGNYIKIACDDYEENYVVTYGHLYPNSANVKVGDTVNHWTQLALVGTTGYSTGNHLHYQVNDSEGNLLDGMQFIDMSKN